MSRYRSGDALVFGAAVFVLLVHALDDALLHRQPGVGSQPTEAAWLRLNQTWPRRRLVQLDDEES